jgi:hypothetical protein
MLLWEPWWNSPTVFGDYRPSYNIPGTSNSPEFLLWNNISVVQRSEALSGNCNWNTARLYYILRLVLAL